MRYDMEREKNLSDIAHTGHDRQDKAQIARYGYSFNDGM